MNKYQKFEISVMSVWLIAAGRVLVLGNDGQCGYVMVMLSAVLKSKAKSKRLDFTALTDWLSKSTSHPVHKGPQEDV